jgi:hypothetical protein
MPRFCKGLVTAMVSYSSTTDEGTAMSTRQENEGPSSSGIATATAIAPVSGASKASDIPKPVETAMKVVATMTPSASQKGGAAPGQAAAAQAAETAAVSRSPRFALMAASIVFAGAFGAMGGALGLALFERQAAPQPEALDLTIVQGAMASLRNELSAIKSSVENSNRDVNAQLAKFTERLEKRGPTQPSAQAPARAPADVTGSIRPQALATPSAPPPRIIEGWVLRRVNRGAAIIQGREGAIEVAAGDVVPGIGRIESIRRLDGRWVVLTHGGMITAQPPR